MDRSTLHQGQFFYGDLLITLLVTATICVAEFLSGSRLFCFIQFGVWFLLWFRLELLLVASQVLTTDSITVLYFDFFPFTCFVILMWSNCSHFVETR